MAMPFFLLVTGLEMAFDPILAMKYDLLWKGWEVLEKVSVSLREVMGETELSFFS